MHRQEHRARLDGSNIVRDIRIQHQNVAGLQRVVDAIGLYRKMPVEGVDCNESIRSVLIELAARFECKEHVSDRGAMKDRDLAVTVRSFMGLSPQCSKRVMQIEEMAVPCKSL
jgi:hypothetical protein